MNEPVAWRTHYPSGWEYKDGNPPFELKVNSQLLYTHAVKELTDEEIKEVMTEVGVPPDYHGNFMNFFQKTIKAILRKAQ